MKPSKSLKLFLLLILLLNSTFSIIAQISPTEINGRVEDKGGNPLSGCTVLFFQADTITGYTTTDNKGKFEIKGLPKGEYKCKVSCIGYEQAS